MEQSPWRRLIRRRDLLKGIAVSATAPSLLTALLAACSNNPGDGSRTSKKDRIVIGIVQEPTTLDVTADATASIALLLRDNLYEGLVRMDPITGHILPAIATKWEQGTDGKTFTFHLASGVRWHDGSPFTALDVKWSWDRAKDPGTKPPNPHADYWAPVQQVQVLDDRTVKVTLERFSFNFLYHMTSGSAAILSQRSLATDSTTPVGTGPFRFSSWNRGASLSLVRNEAYWGVKPILKDVEFHFITDASAMANALRAGDLDVIGQVQAYEQLASLKADASFHVIEGQPLGKVMVSFNNGRAPLSDVRVRRAIARAIDRKAWIEGIYSGYAVPIGSHAVPNDGEPYYADETTVNAFDPTGARRLLADAGYPTGLTLRLAEITSLPYAVRGSDILVSQLKAIGVTVKVEGLDFPAWLRNVFLGGDYDLTIINHTEERDIGNYANSKYYWHYSSSTVTQLLADADAELDDAKRKDLYSRILRQLADDAANGWVLSPKIVVVLAQAVRGFPAGSVSPAFYLGDTYFA